jgi:hypothetical protein
MLFITMNIKKALTFFFATGIFATFLAGCSATGLPKPSNAEVIRLQNKTIVLFRVYGEMLGDPLKDSEYFIEMANLDRDEIPKEYTLTTFPSSNARTGGWAYFVLEPGIYHFTVVPGYKAQDDGPDKIDAETGKLTRRIFGKTMDISTFRFRVPAGIPVLYIGSFSFSCKGQAGMSWNVEECTDVRVNDEVGAASFIAQTDFSRNGQMAALLSNKYGTFDAKKVQDLMPVGVEVSGRLGPDSPDWIETSRDRAVLPNYAFFMGGPLGVPFYLPFYPYGVVVWSPCMELIAREFQYFDLITQVSGTLFKNRRILKLPDLAAIDGISQAANNDNDIKGILYANIRRVVLRECNESWDFCVEVEMRARLKDVTTGNYVYDSILQYTFSQKGRPRGRDRYILPVPEASECRELSTYCSAEGPHILRAELKKAARVLAEKVLRDLGPGNN